MCVCVRVYARTHVNSAGMKNVFVAQNLQIRENTLCYQVHIANELSRNGFHFFVKLSYAQNYYCN